MKLMIFVILVSVVTSRAALTTWSLNELSTALQDPSLDPKLKPYLEYGLNKLMADLHAGIQEDTIVLDIPDDLLPPSKVPDTA